MWDQLTIGYLAALIDGEGHIYSGHRAYVSVTSCDRDIVQRAFDMSRIGNIQGPYRHKNPNHSEYWVWMVSKHKDVARLLLAVAPLLSERKRTTQIIPMIDRLSAAILRPRSCDVCETIYTPRKYLTGTKTPKYCSGKCGSKAYRLRKAVV